MAEKSKVSVKNTTDSERVYSDVVCGSVLFKPGEAKTIEVSAAEADALKEGRAGWELTTKAEADKSAKAMAAGGAPVKMSRADLDAMTKEELVSQASSMGIEVAQSWLKDDIVNAIVKGQK